jgi:ribosomal protein eS8
VRGLVYAGISRDSTHKRRATGGKKKSWRKKCKYELGRQGAMTKLSSNKTVRRIRVRGGNSKFRALRLDTGNFSWGSEAVTRKTRILDVVYNASNNELVRTQTLVKNAIIQVDAAPFRTWYSQHYGLEIGKKKKAAVKKDEVIIVLVCAISNPVRSGLVSYSIGVHFETRKLVKDMILFWNFRKLLRPRRRRSKARVC